MHKSHCCDPCQAFISTPKHVSEPWNSHNVLSSRRTSVPLCNQKHPISQGWPDEVLHIPDGMLLTEPTIQKSCALLCAGLGGPTSPEPNLPFQSLSSTGCKSPLLLQWKEKGGLKACWDSPLHLPALFFLTFTQKGHSRIEVYHIWCWGKIGFHSFLAQERLEILSYFYHHKKSKQHPLLVLKFCNTWKAAPA